MASMRLGGTIALPGFSNIKIEVEANGYAQTKEYLRVVLLQMCKEQHTTEAITAWWRTIFGTYIFDDFVQPAPTAKPVYRDNCGTISDMQADSYRDPIGFE